VRPAPSENTVRSTPDKIGQHVPNDPGRDGVNALRNGPRPGNRRSGFGSRGPPPRRSFSSRIPWRVLEGEFLLLVLESEAARRSFVDASADRVWRQQVTIRPMKVRCSAKRLRLSNSARALPGHDSRSAASLRATGRTSNMFPAQHEGFALGSGQKPVSILIVVGFAGSIGTEEAIEGAASRPEDSQGDVDGGHSVEQPASDPSFSTASCHGSGLGRGSSMLPSYATPSLWTMVSAEQTVKSDRRAFQILVGDP